MSETTYSGEISILSYVTWEESNVSMWATEKLRKQERLRHLHYEKFALFDIHWFNSSSTAQGGPWLPQWSTTIPPCRGFSSFLLQPLLFLDRTWNFFPQCYVLDSHSIICVYSSLLFMVYILNHKKLSECISVIFLLLISRTRKIFLKIWADVFCNNSITN